ncbi:hypothetical protein, partial [Xanthomonas axonopodis]|uniref:hypothetical protein n=1 Tax=Xanthomonas axonopodis TaxID=53413 RepID=UPI001C4DE382
TVVLRVAEGQLHRNCPLGSLVDCGRSGWIVQSFLSTYPAGLSPEVNLTPLLARRLQPQNLQAKNHRFDGGEDHG